MVSDKRMISGRVPTIVISFNFLKSDLQKCGIGFNMIIDFIGENVLETQTVFLPAGDGKVNFALRKEIAEALANVITTEGHENKSYDIGGEETVSFTKIAGLLSEISGKEINYVSPDVETYKKELAKHHVPEMYISMFAAFAVAFSENAMDVSSDDFNNLLGRRATDVKSFFTETFSTISTNTNI